MLSLGFWTFLFVYGLLVFASIRWPAILLAKPWPAGTSFSSFGQGIAWVLLSGVFLVNGLLSADFSAYETWVALLAGAGLAWGLGVATLIAVWSAIEDRKRGGT